MNTVIDKRAHLVLAVNTFAFTICFACWMLNGVLVTYLVDNQVFDWSPVKVGWLMGIPVLTGAIFRLPFGLLTDKYGGRPIYTLLLLLAAIPMFLLSKVDSFMGFALCSFGFGITGAGFAVGNAFTSYWYPKERQGLAMGIFGAGNAGAAITTMLAPTILNDLTDGGKVIDSWRVLPQIYAGVLVLTAIIFFVLVKNKKPVANERKISELFAPLKKVRVWRFGIYYALVFGMFVSFSQWLIPYFVNVYYLPLVTAGIFAAMFSFPSGVIRVLGGWMSDKWGARKVMYWVLSTSVIFSLMMSVPKMDITTPGNGIMATKAGTVKFVSDSLIIVNDMEYPVVVEVKEVKDIKYDQEEFHIFPVKKAWQTPVVTVGEKIEKKQLLAKGETHILFQANVWIFAILAIILGSIWGIGKAAVFKHIPEYFPSEVGVVGGMVGLIGGFGGFLGPIVFGYLLEYTGLWTSSWIFIFLFSLICIVWMHRVILKMRLNEAPNKH
ncbi:MAG: NarK/NasA family nitrate transporter [Bacteroidetes bacterium]|nr:MAG: NarK/NasA family nitrate transporter [Bacteroidota bacterium]MBL1143305.1 NarK/NasA family nitrate transporter [Bacteroidota bacterium]MCB0802521.1 NarK/NasA family nitrate transporter [Flavobacteriales bacterium]NOG56107.1 NarK/NasA family nitrate transporter [Bacteroidota bacterium]